jgi:hypothetical protein
MRVIAHPDPRVVPRSRRHAVAAYGAPLPKLVLGNELQRSLLNHLCAAQLALKGAGKGG